MIIKKYDRYFESLGKTFYLLTEDDKLYNDFDSIGVGRMSSSKRFIPFTKKELEVITDDINAYLSSFNLLDKSTSNIGRFNDTQIIINIESYDSLPVTDKSVLIQHTMIMKLPDEWYLFYYTNEDGEYNYNLYKCDQLDGLRDCIKSINI